MDFENYVFTFLTILPIVLLAEVVFLFIFKNRKELVSVIFGFIVLIMVNHFIVTQMNYISEHVPKYVKWALLLLVLAYVGFFRALYSWIKVMKRTPSEP